MSNKKREKLTPDDHDLRGLDDPLLVGYCAVYEEGPNAASDQPRSSARISRDLLARDPRDAVALYLSEMRYASLEDNERMGRLFAELCEKVRTPMRRT